MKAPSRLQAGRPTRRWPRWLVLFALGVPMLLLGYVLWSTYVAPLPTKGAGDMVRDFLKGAAPFSEALATAGREDGRAHVYMRFRTEPAGVQQIVQDFSLIQSEATAAQIGAIRRDDRMPEWWQPQQELSSGKPMWTGAKDGWLYELYFAPDTGVTYFEWTLQ